MRFFTNLDEAQRLLRDLDERVCWGHPPMVGTLLEFTHPITRHTAQLEVVAVVYDVKAQEYRVELHIPRGHHTKTIREWTAWFKKHWRVES